VSDTTAAVRRVRMWVQQVRSGGSACSPATSVRARRPGHISYAPYVRFLFCVQSQVRQIVGRQSRLLALCPSSTGWGVRFCRCTGRTRRGLGFFTPGTVARAWPLGSDVRAFGHKGFAVAPCATHIRVCEKFAVFFQLSHTPNRPGLFTRACRW
jgi:hypothetical protein